MFTCLSVSIEYCDIFTCLCASLRYMSYPTSPDNDDLASSGTKIKKLKTKKEKLKLMYRLLNNTTANGHIHSKNTLQFTTVILRFKMHTNYVPSHWGNFRQKFFKSKFIHSGEICNKHSSKPNSINWKNTTVITKRSYPCCQMHFYVHSSMWSVIHLQSIFYFRHNLEG